jgi:uncharacterized membrane protein
MGVQIGAAEPPEQLEVDHRRFHAPHAHLASPFGESAFGKAAEGFARFFGTPRFILGQTVLVVIWIAVNAAVVAFRWDPYPFILLNLTFSTQAAYAAPLILLAQTRQADRDKAWSDADSRHREELSQTSLMLLKQNTDLTVQVAELSKEVRRLTQDVHDRVIGAS